MNVVQNGLSVFENVCEFDIYGVVVCLFIKMFVYRGSLNLFVVVGLEVKSFVEFYNDLFYECVWIFGFDLFMWVFFKGVVIKMFFDVGNVYSCFYSVVIINCIFVYDVGGDKKGGQFVLYVSYGDYYFKNFECIVVLMEFVDEYFGVEYYDFLMQ